MMRPTFERGLGQEALALERCKRLDEEPPPAQRVRTDNDGDWHGAEEVRRTLRQRANGSNTVTDALHGRSKS